MCSANLRHTPTISSLCLIQCPLPNISIAKIQQRNIVQRKVLHTLLSPQFGFSPQLTAFNAVIRLGTSRKPPLLLCLPLLLLTTILCLLVCFSAAVSFSRGIGHSGRSLLLLAPLASGLAFTQHSAGQLTRVLRVTALGVDRLPTLALPLRPACNMSVCTYHCLRPPLIISIPAPCPSNDALPSFQ
ncbi:hypothetical protein FN846DRAFT_957148 [Sphaerosporella brunnea]|uniref:Uncharacterized protein n=1 Tax=Sphaerosporella brunnea TaxID=1250544 RepID=A0A5J5ES33_9PEZI|nr:hypothetical protein FN846DRAFT_957148 [Sphaerosporella brunnea]